MTGDSATGSPAAGSPAADAVADRTVDAAGTAAGSVWDRNRRAVLVALVGWAWARCCVAAGFWVAHVAVGGEGRRTLDQGLISWDGAFYVNIAQAGYEGAPPDAVRFFPLYPALGRVLAFPFAGREDVALVVLANVGALLGAVLLWHLAREALADPTGRTALDPTEAGAVADRSAWMVALVPASFVLAFAYTEGVALALTAATLLCVQRRSWVWAGVWAMFAAALRPVGGLLLVPIVIELLRVRPRPKVWPAVCAAAGPLIGFAIANAVIATTTGDWLSAWEAQRPIRAEFRNPLVRSAEAVWALLHDNLTDVENVPFIVLWCALVAVSVWKRQPWSWIALSAVTLVVALSSQQIDSIGRYGLLAVGLVVALAQWAGPRWRQVLVGCVGSAGIAWLTAEVLAGRVVP